MSHNFIKTYTVIFPAVLLALLTAASCGSNKTDDGANGKTPKQVQSNSTNNNQMKNYNIRVIKNWKHDPAAFTQGLIFMGDYMLESTGLEGPSSLRKIDFAGNVLKQIKVPSQYFAEGIAVFKDKIFQLTWVSNLCFVYDLGTFKKVNEFRYQGEGWGLTNDDKFLYMSDGTNILRVKNPDNFQTVREINVMDDNFNPISNLNELEFINGDIWANIWQTDKIVIINPTNGKVKAYIDLTPLRSYLDPSIHTDVLNGIAYDKDNNRIFVTGKDWPLMFEIALAE